MELNPNHTNTAATREQWHNLCLILMVKFGVHSVDITSADIEETNNLFISGPAIVVEPKGDVINLRIVSMDEGLMLAKKEGGRPV